ncbi:MAG: hypothetical protein AMXMBFR64_46620 [Myxococcales bacterium]
MSITSLHTIARASAPDGLTVELIVAIVVAVIVFGLAAAWAIKRNRLDSGEQPPALPPKGAEKPSPKGAEKPSPRGAEKPSPRGAEKPSPRGAEKPLSRAKGPAPESPPEEAPATFAQGLAKTTGEGFVSKLGKLFRGKQLDEALLDEVEAVLYTADIGVTTSEKLLAGLRAALGRKELSSADKVWATLREQTLEMLESANAGGGPLQVPDGPRPYVVLVIGVNGTGKTTSIGKIAARLSREGHKVLLAAGDTFRAAAVEQLEVWGRRVGVEVWRGGAGADPASVVFDAVEHAKKSGHDVVLADTAGRLHTHGGLVDELKKVHRVTGKAMQGAPHEVILVLDSTMGQNAMQQARLFRDAVPVTGLVLTKLDGTAKGGVVIGICDELGLPIRFIGVGERVQDLRPFDSREFVDALFGRGDAGQMA